MTTPALGTDPANPPAAPEHLGEQGTALWSGVLARYSLRVDEVMLLEQAARCVDDLERIGQALREADLIVPGSMGQAVAHPLLSEVRQLRATLATHLRQLGLPDEAAPGVETKSPRHQRAAQTRWSAHRAAVAAERARTEEA